MDNSNATTSQAQINVNHISWSISGIRGQKPTGPGPKFRKLRTGPDQNKAKFEDLGPDRTRTNKILKFGTGRSGR